MRRRLEHAPGAQHAHVEAHEERDRDRHRDREHAPRRLRERVDDDERQDRQQDDHDREDGEQRGDAADRPDLVARHLARATCRRGASRRTAIVHVLHGAGEDHADDDPQRAGQVAHLGGEHGADQRPGAGDRGEVVAEQDAPVRRLEVHVVVEPLGGRRPLVVDPEHLLGDEARVEADTRSRRSRRRRRAARRPRSSRRAPARRRPSRSPRRAATAVQIAIERVPALGFHVLSSPEGRRAEARAEPEVRWQIRDEATHPEPAPGVDADVTARQMRIGHPVRVDGRAVVERPRYAREPARAVRGHAPQRHLARGGAADGDAVPVEHQRVPSVERLSCLLRYAGPGVLLQDVLGPGYPFPALGIRERSSPSGRARPGRSPFVGCTVVAAATPMPSTSNAAPAQA